MAVFYQEFKELKNYRLAGNFITNFLIKEFSAMPLRVISRLKMTKDYLWQGRRVVGLPMSVLFGKKLTDCLLIKLIYCNFAAELMRR